MNDNPATISKIKAELAKSLVGQDNLVPLLCGLLTGEHILLEGNPGLGKTLAVKSLGSRRRLRCEYIHADLLPSEVWAPDLLEGRTMNENRSGQRKSRARGRNQPRTVKSSALLEAMQERQVTIAGQAYPRNTS